VYLSVVDIGGSPTPDEPTVFTIDDLTALVEESFAIVSRTDHHRPHSKGRVCSVRILARKGGDPRAAHRQGSGAEHLTGAAEARPMRVTRDFAGSGMLMPRSTVKEVRLGRDTSRTLANVGHEH
jgi:hypothetical protein